MFPLVLLFCDFCHVTRDSFIVDWAVIKAGWARYPIPVICATFPFMLFQATKTIVIEVYRDVMHLILLFYDFCHVTRDSFGGGFVGFNYGRRAEGGLNGRT